MPAQRDTELQTRPSHRNRAWTAAAATLLAAAGAGSGLALAAGGSTTVKSAANAKLGESVVVDASGHTVYALSPETRSHLLCTSSQCTAIWPPVTVKSKTTKLKAGKGVKGKLAILRRSNGKFQVTLGGLPLYRFAGDSSAGQANGNGINSFGGHWHVIKATASTSSTPAPSTTTMTTTPTYSPPAY
jgi:predicted lipoprotein with Yx(FWY)xxD motif